MLDTIILSVCALLSGLGLLTSWSQTMLKPKIIGLFFQSQRGKTFREVSDWLEVYSPVFGHLLNCGYCLSGYVSLGFFLFYLFLPIDITVVITLFFSSSLFWHLLHKPRGDTGESFEIVEEASTDDSPFQPKSDGQREWTLEVPSEVQERLDRQREDPQSHRDLLKANTGLLSTLNNPANCRGNVDCENLVKAYREELQAMEREHRRDPEGCPECTRGVLINKYFFLLGDLLGMKEAEETSPTPEKDESK